MLLPPNLVQATFLRRVNRFTVLVELAGRETLVHLANSGRLRELLVPGNTVHLAHRPGTHRKTAYDLQLVELGPILVSADSRLPNRLVLEAFQDHRLPQFVMYNGAKPEVVYGDSRLDVLLSGEDGDCYIEIKSVTLVEDGVGLFPDAATDRGRRHLGTLATAKSQGNRAAVIFVVQREDVQQFAPHAEADPAFAQELRRVDKLGVEIYAYRCAVTSEEIVLSDEVPVSLGG